MSSPVHSNLRCSRFISFISRAHETWLQDLRVDRPMLLQPENLMTLCWYFYKNTQLGVSRTKRRSPKVWSTRLQVLWFCPYGFIPDYTLIQSWIIQNSICTPKEFNHWPGHCQYIHWSLLYHPVILYYTYGLSWHTMIYILYVMPCSLNGATAVY